MLRKQQDAYLDAVRQWRKAMEGSAPATPWPEPAPLGTMPKPNEMAEVSYAFAARLLAEQSQFMEELSKAMGVEDGE